MNDWTGYGICVFPVNPEKPCRWIEIQPSQMATLEVAKGMAEGIWKSSGCGRDYSQVVVDRWHKGKIVEPRVYVLDNSVKL